MAKLSNGILCIGPPLLATTAYLLSILANGRCNLVKVADNVNGIVGWFLDQITPRSLGLWCFVAPNGESVDTRDDELDDKFMAARAIGTTVITLGLIVWIISLFSVARRCVPRAVILLNAFLAMSLCILQGLVFLIFKSDVCQALTCSLDSGGYCGAAAVVTWLIAAIMTLAWAQDKK